MEVNSATSGSVGGPSGGGGLRPQDLMRGLLQDLAEAVGVVHLAMHATDSGLVVQWRHEVVAVVEPGACAEMHVTR